MASSLDSAVRQGVYSVRDSPMVPAPAAEDVFTPEQWETLLAVADTVVPNIIPTSKKGSISASQKAVDDASYEKAKSSVRMGSQSSESGETAVAYLSENATAVADFKESLARTFGMFVPDENKRGLSLVLTGLNNRVVSLFLTGSSAPFQSHPYHIREAILRGWEKSYLPAMRTVHRALVAISVKTWVTLSPSLPKVLGFPRLPVHGPAATAEGYPYRFLQFPPGDEPEVVETDVVIVGSGIGAGITAKNLAEAGHRVMVVEKSNYFPPSHFPMDGNQGAVHMFSSAGAELSNDSSVALISGSTFGGGGTINWSASLQTQHAVRQEWANAGLPFFTSMAFQSSLDRVCSLMGVQSDQIDHNHGNQVVLEGSRKLGYAAKPVPQNTGNKKHYCGYCAFGCAESIKQGPTVCTFPAAAEAGTTFVEGFHVDKVLFDEQTATDKRKIAVGVQGTWTSRDENQGVSGTPTVKRKVIVKAKKVVVAGGTLQSPLLLLRSGLKNPHIGRHLYLHPVVVMSAAFDYDINPWEGGMLTSVVNEFENMDGRFHGAKIETLAMVPGLFLPLFPWKSGLDYKQFAANMKRTNGFISVTRDRDTGRVYPDPTDGRCRVEYTPSAFDRQHTLEGLIASAKIAYVSGAREIRATCRDVPVFERPAPADNSSAYDEGINNAAFQDWVKKVRSNVRLDPATTSYASAHQMGTCRMGANPKRSVVDPQGEVWGTNGLYVTDASVFPSASGVNPMVTNMALSDWTSRKLAERLGREKKTEGAARL